MEIFFLVFYSIILLANILAQFSNTFHNTTKYDFLLLINIFRLFSPNPIISDIRIFYRDLFFDNTQTELMEYKYYITTSIKRSLWLFVKPNFFVIFKCLKGIKKMSTKNVSEDTIFKSYYYKRIENEVLKKNRKKNTISRQIIFFRHTSYLDKNNTDLYLVKNIPLIKK
jgi:hypothetical protein